MNEKLKHVLNIAMVMYKDIDNERIQLETKLHNYSYIFLGIVAIKMSLYSKLLLDEMLITPISFYHLLIIDVLGWIIMGIFFFKTYIYNGFYSVNDKISSYIDIGNNEKNSIDDLINADIGAWKQCIIHNKELNHKRNGFLHLAKESLRYYILIMIISTIIIFIFN